MTFVLSNRNTDPAQRVVVIGANGVIGDALCDALVAARRPMLRLRGSRDLDLAASGAAVQLAALLEPTDAVVMLAALTPNRGRDAGTLCRNVVIAEAVCGALVNRPVGHVTYVSSDAVYPRRVEDVSEASCVEGSDSYSVMHQVREIMFRESVDDRLSILRPTQVFAANDSHNAYGPCRFLRTVRDENRIDLFGRGEETRDHIAVDDLVALILRCIDRAAVGTLNVASGDSVSFADLADKVAELCAGQARVVHIPRTIPVTHRRFDTGLLRKTFPDFIFTPLDVGLARLYGQMNAMGGW